MASYAACFVNAPIRYKRLKACCTIQPRALPTFTGSVGKAGRISWKEHDCLDLEQSHCVPSSRLCGQALFAGLKPHYRASFKIRDARAQAESPNDGHKYEDSPLLGDWGGPAEAENVSQPRGKLMSMLLLLVGVVGAFILTKFASRTATPVTADSAPALHVQHGGQHKQSDEDPSGINQDSHYDDEEAIKAARQGLMNLPAQQTETVPSISSSAADEGRQDDQFNLSMSSGQGESDTQEPVLQHLFDDLQQRSQSTLPETAEAPDHASMNNPRTTLTGSGVEASGLAQTSKEGSQVGKLDVEPAEIQDLANICGQEELQQRAALAARAAQAALQAASSATCHSQASSKAAMHAASHANNAMLAASHAATAAEKGAADDLERALRRVQHAQQQARDAEAAAAIATGSTDAMAEVAAEQERMAVEASKRSQNKENDTSSHDSVLSHVQVFASKLRGLVDTACAWCSQVWQAFIGWTCAIGERVQQAFFGKSL